METTISVRQMVQIKNTAKNVAADVVKKQRIAKKIVELKKEYDEVSGRIDAWQAPIKSMTGGFTTEDLIVREVKPYMNEDGTQKQDKQGHLLTNTEFIPNTKLVRFDENRRVYVIEIPETPEANITDCSNNSSMKNTEPVTVGPSFD